MSESPEIGTEHLIHILKKIHVKAAGSLMTATQKNSAGNQDNPKVLPDDKRAIKEKNLDKTIEDSFPTSDPPSTIPNPEEEEDAA